MANCVAMTASTAAKKASTAANLVNIADSMASTTVTMDCIVENTLRRLLQPVKMDCIVVTMDYTAVTKANIAANLVNTVGSMANIAATTASTVAMMVNIVDSMASTAETMDCIEATSDYKSDSWVNRSATSVSTAVMKASSQVTMDCKKDWSESRWAMWANSSVKWVNRLAMMESSVERWASNAEKTANSPYLHYTMAKSENKKVKWANS